MQVAVGDLKEKVLAGINKLGYRGEEAAIIVEVLLYAQLRGNNQGITKIAAGGVPKAADTEPLRVIKQATDQMLMRRLCQPYCWCS